MKFGDHLKQERLKREFTQQKVADDLNVSRQTISSWETEHSYPDIGSLLDLSDYYQVSLDKLLKEDTGMTEYLKKQEILKSIKPIIWVLTTIDIIFLGFALLNLFDVIKLKPLVGIIIVLMGLLNIVAMLQLASFRNKVETIIINRPRFYKVTSFLSIVSLVAAVAFYFQNDAKLSGLFFGIAVGIMVIMFLNRFKNKSQS